MPDALPSLAILAGGLATRMYPLTSTMPKSLLPVCDEPFFAHQLRLLVSQGWRDIVVCCGHLGEQIEAFAGDGARFGSRIRYSYDGKQLRGTGGALRHALPLLGETFFVMYGDSYLLADPANAWRAYKTLDCPALMCVFRNEGRWDTSNVRLENGRVSRYDKRLHSPAMKHIDYGLSLLSASLLQQWPEDTPFDLADVFSELAACELLAAHEVEERFYEIGSPKGLRETGKLLSQRAHACFFNRELITGGRR